MKYGITLPSRGLMANPEDLITIARRADELGYDSLSVGDHIVVPRSIASRYPYSEAGNFPSSGSGEAMEQLSLLTFVAGHTKRIRLVPSVMIVPHRNPLVAAKVLATLDILSEGRLVLGVGVGWMREEFETLGLPPFDKRGAVTDEYIRAFKELWTSDNPSFDGKYCSFSNITFLPKPAQRPHPLIWVGGESQRALRRAAELGDGWYPIGSNPAFPMGQPDQLAAGIERLATFARRAGRDPARIEVIYRTHEFEIQNGGSGQSPSRNPFVGTADDIASDVRMYQDMGVGVLVVDIMRLSSNIDDALFHMENFATKVWPKV